jgi:hypothetical protein
MAGHPATDCDHTERDPTRWAADPEKIDPDDYPPFQPLVKLMTWAFCPSCRLQAHVLYTQFLLQGIDCPTCGARLLPPPDAGPEHLQLALHREDDFSRQIVDVD